MKIIHSGSTPGFTLVELLAATGILALMLTLLFSLMGSFDQGAALHTSKTRLDEVARSLRQYYLGRGDLPVPLQSTTVPAPLGEVPVAALHLDQKLRLDQWGQYIHYYAVRNDGADGRPGKILVDPLSEAPNKPADAPEAMVVIPQYTPNSSPADGRTLIRGIEVHGQRFAAILISSGPDQVFGYRRIPGYPEQFVLDPGSDDIILALDLTPEAVRLATGELQVLTDKATAFDNRYIGRDNDGDGEFDEGCDPAQDVNCDPNEGSCVPIPYPAIPEVREIGSCNSPCDPCATFPYYPEGGGIPVTTADYSCGLPTLDFMKAHYCDITGGNCPTGYYFPEILEYGIEIQTESNGVPPIRHVCGTIPPDYLRLPFNRTPPIDPNACHWGLVKTLWSSAPDQGETRADQARAFVFCLFGLTPDQMVDPWLNGYAWGCGTSDCPQRYPDTDPHYHRFFSAGPDGVVATPDDIVAH